MGNCLFGGGIGAAVDVTGIGNHGNGGSVIKVVTTDGGVMEFGSPITAEFITDEFPGHGIFRSHDLFWKPLAHRQVLEAGESYYLLPLGSNTGDSASATPCVANNNNFNLIRNGSGHVRSNSASQVVEANSQIHHQNHHQSGVPYRMSFDSRGILKRSHTAAHQQFSAYCSNNNNNNNGFWKVKLVISPQQLMEILSQEGRTQELLESVRTVAKCRNGGGNSPLLFSGQYWSFSGSSSSSSGGGGNSRRNNADSSSKDGLSIDFF